MLRRIEACEVEALYISVHGKPKSAANRRLIERAELMAERRAENEVAKPAAKRIALEVFFYDADAWLRGHAFIAKTPRAQSSGWSCHCIH